MLSTFLSAPTDHEQTLEFVNYDVVESRTEIFSDQYPLINHELSVLVSVVNTSLLVMYPLSSPLNGCLSIQT